MKFSKLDLMSVGNTRQLAGAVFAGEGDLLLCLFPEDRGDISSDSFGGPPEFRGRDGEVLDVVVLDMNGDEWKKFVRQTDVLETEVLQGASDGKLAKAVLRKSARQIEARISWEVFRRDGYACRYCGRDDVPLTVDHLVLWEEGGPSVPENLVSACKKCNKTRGNTPYAEWLKSPGYARVSSSLPGEVHQRNLLLVDALDSIPRRVSRRSR